MRVHAILTSYTISFADISAAAMFQDIDKLIIGIVMMFIYIQLIVSKFNLVECRVSKIFIVTFKLFFLPGISVCVYIKKTSAVLFSLRNSTKSFKSCGERFHCKLCSWVTYFHTELVHSVSFHCFKYLRGDIFLKSFQELYFNNLIWITLHSLFFSANMDGDMQH